MINIIDMAEATFTAGSFAIWDTVTESFYQNKDGDQAFNNFEEFKASCPDLRKVERVRNLLPVASIIGSSKLYVCCRSDLQLQLLCHHHGIQRDQVKRVRRADSVRNIQPQLPLILLDGSRRGTDQYYEVMEVWKAYGGTTLKVGDGVVNGQAPFLLNFES